MDLPSCETAWPEAALGDGAGLGDGPGHFGSLPTDLGSLDKNAEVFGVDMCQPYPDSHCGLGDSHVADRDWIDNVSPSDDGRDRRQRQLLSMSQDDTDDLKDRGCSNRERWHGQRLDGGLPSLDLDEVTALPELGVGMGGKSLSVPSLMMNYDDGLMHQDDPISNAGHVGLSTHDEASEDEEDDDDDDDGDEEADASDQGEDDDDDDDASEDDDDDESESDQDDLRLSPHSNSMSPRCLGGDDSPNSWDSMQPNDDAPSAGSSPATPPPRPDECGDGSDGTSVDEADGSVSPSTEVDHAQGGEKCLEAARMAHRDIKQPPGQYTAQPEPSSEILTLNASITGSAVSPQRSRPRGKPLRGVVDADDMRMKCVAHSFTPSA